MNKKLYRLIFSKARGMLIAVAEFTRSHRTVGNTINAVSKGNSKQQISKLSAISFGLLLALGAVQTVNAAIVADPNAAAGQQAVIKNNGGVTQIDIQAPSAGGVSHNVYNQFDVGSEGVILNNSAKDTYTQLGGMINGNASLAQGEAKIILNEVNSLNASQLNGLVEVAGKNAQVIISNPSGITCNGCGFINANRATLTTGQAQMENGVLTGYNVEKGEISIQGSGMDTSSQNYTDIIARSVKVNAQIQGRDLKITTGRNKVDATNTAVTKLADTTEAKPELALDVSSLGSMYVGQITLIGTEKGVGVNNAGDIYASAGSVVLNADGNIVNSGKIYGKEALVINTSGDVNNRSDKDDYDMYSDKGSLLADGNLTITAASLTSDGGSKIKAGSNESKESADLNISVTGGLTAKGFTYAKNNMVLHGDTLDFSGGITTARQALTLTGNSLINRRGSLSSYGDLTINLTGDMDNGKDEAYPYATGGTVISSGQLNINAANIVNQGQFISLKDTFITAASLTNTRDGSIITGNSYEQLLSSLNINLTGGLTSKGYIFAANNIVLHGDTLDLSNGITKADKGILLTGGTLKNWGGTVQSGEELTIDVTGDVDVMGNLSSGKDMTITASSLTNHALSRIEAGTTNGKMADLNINVTGALTLNGDTYASKNLNLHGSTLKNERGTVTSGEKLIIDVTGDVDNLGNLSSGTNMTITADSLTNGEGSKIYAGTSGGKLADLTITVAGALTSKGSMFASNDIVLHGDTLAFDGGTISANRALTLTGGTLTTQNVNMRSWGDLSIDVTGDVFNGEVQSNLYATGGSLNSGGKLTINAANITNQGTIASAKEMTITAASLTSSKGSTIKTSNLYDDEPADLNINIRGALTLQGKIDGANNVDLHGDTLDLSGGVITTGKALLLTGETLKNWGGVVISGEDLTIDVTGEMVNARDETSPYFNGGSLSAGGKLTLNAANVINQGRIASDKDMTITAASLTSGEGSSIQAGDNYNSVLSNLTINVTETLTAKGKTYASGDMVLQGSVLDLSDSDIQGNNITLAANEGKGTIDTSRAQIVARKDLTATGSDITNNSGKWVASNASVTTGILNNQDGEMNISKNLTIVSDETNNQGGRLTAEGTLSLTSAVLNNQDGKIAGVDKLQLSVPQINNENGQIVNGVLPDSNNDSEQAVNDELPDGNNDSEQVVNDELPDSNNDSEQAVNDEQPDSNNDSEQAVNDELPDSNNDSEQAVNDELPDSNNDSEQAVNDEHDSEQAVNDELPDSNNDSEQAVNDELPDSNNDSEQAVNDEQPDSNNDSEQAVNDELPDSNNDSEQAVNDELPDSNNDSEQAVNDELPDSNNDSEQVVNDELPDSNNDSEQAVNDEQPDSNNDSEQAVNDEQPDSNNDSEQIVDGDLPDSNNGNEQIVDGDLPDSNNDSEQVVNDDLPDSNNGSEQIVDGDLPDSNNGSEQIVDGDLPDSNNGNEQIVDGDLPDGNNDSEQVVNDDVPDATLPPRKDNSIVSFVKSFVNSFLNFWAGFGRKA